jgi:hypothetical protein
MSRNALATIVIIGGSVTSSFLAERVTLGLEVSAVL